MSWYDRALRETVTYWAPGSPDGYGGTSYDAPTTLAALLERRTETDYDGEGGEHRSDSVAYLKTDVERGGYLAPGDQTGTSDPTTLHDAFEITEVRQQGGLTATSSTIRVALLQEASRPS